MIEIDTVLLWPIANVPFVGDRLSQFCPLLADQFKSELPLLVSVYVWLDGLNGPPTLPAETRDVPGVTLIAAIPCTAVIAWTVLLLGLGSAALDVSAATFVRMASADWTITTFTVAEAPPASAPSAHETNPFERLYEPCEVVAETKVTPGGRRSNNCASGTPFGPLLLTVMVYVRLLATPTGSGESSMDTTRSAGGAVPREIQRTPPPTLTNTSLPSAEVRTRPP